MTTLVDVYKKSLNFNPRIVVTRHCVERLLERKLDVEKFVRTLHDIDSKMCETIYEYTNTGRDVIFKGDGIVVPVVFKREEMKLYVCTAFVDRRGNYGSVNNQSA